MDRSKKKLRIALIGLAVALAFGGGALVALWGSGGRLSYTGTAGNPSISGADTSKEIAQLTGEVAVAPMAERPQPKNFTFRTPGGPDLTPAALKGKVVLVNLWATWCPPCVAEMGALDTLQGKLGGPGFQVMAVSLDRGGHPVVRRWFDKNGIKNLEVFNADPAQFGDAMLPTSILLDARGRVVWQGIGQRAWDGAEAEAVIRQVMTEG